MYIYINPTNCFVKPKYLCSYIDISVFTEFVCNSNSYVTESADKDSH